MVDFVRRQIPLTRSFFSYWRHKAECRIDGQEIAADPPSEYRPDQLKDTVRTVCHFPVGLPFASVRLCHDVVELRITSRFVISVMRVRRSAAKCGGRALRCHPSRRGDSCSACRAGEPFVGKLGKVCDLLRICLSVAGSALISSFSISAWYPFALDRAALSERAG